MELFGDVRLGQGYRGPTQRTRLISEGWIARHGYCLKCDSDRLQATTANTRTCDFQCVRCHHRYELKSKCGTFTNRVLDGAYAAMMRTIREGTTPTFLLLEYEKTWAINGIKAIHHSLITETTIEARKPLADTARRAGWIGCNILLTGIANEGKIAIVEKREPQPKHLARLSFSRLERLSSLTSSERSWAGSLLNSLQRMPSPRFSLTEVYDFAAAELQRLFPRNRHIKPKIRQQLQVLRDAGFINFVERGNYELVPKYCVSSDGRLV